MYIGDAVEESLDEAEHAAASLRLRGTRVIILHDTDPQPTANDDPEALAFARIASITGGAVLPFDHSSVDRLRELQEYVLGLEIAIARCRRDGDLVIWPA